MASAVRCCLSKAVAAARSCHTARHMTTASATANDGKTLLQVLEQRGMIAGFHNEEGLRTLLDSVSPGMATPPSVYVGFDPTGPSLHAGHLMALITLRHFQAAGFRPIALIGGATGLIGDPSGRSTEREQLDVQTVAGFAEGIRASLGTVLDLDDPVTGVELVNNATFYNDMNAVHFVREVCSHVRLGAMLSRPTVRDRMATEEGMSLAEFCYPVFQAYDFAQLRETRNCRVQIGGSDQLGNIKAGAELVRRSSNQEVYGFTYPLLTTPTGEKFGKSAGNAVWLNDDKTSNYAFYQHFLRAQDVQVRQLLCFLTMLPMDEVEAIIERDQSATSGAPQAQRRLADEVTRMVRGEQGLRKAQQASKLMFGGSLEGATAADFEEIAREVPHAIMPGVTVVDNLLLDVCRAAKLATHDRELDQIFNQGGLYLNNERITDAEARIQQHDLVDGRFCLVRLGRRRQAVVEAS